ncbi:hypothetical protein QSI_4711 [Clostridioides difficile P28]|nr:hypothetical protein QSI_4711 [Clostridioides difficile P28]
MRHPCIEDILTGSVWTCKEWDNTEGHLSIDIASVRERE